MFQRNNTNNDNRRSYIIQNQYFTYQRKCNHELAVQALRLIVAADLQNLINDLSTPSSGGGGGEISVS